MDAYYLYGSRVVTRKHVGSARAALEQAEPDAVLVVGYEYMRRLFFPTPVEAMPLTRIVARHGERAYSLSTGVAIPLPPSDSIWEKPLLGDILRGVASLRSDLTYFDVHDDKHRYLSLLHAERQRQAMASWMRTLPDNSVFALGAEELYSKGTLLKRLEDSVRQLMSRSPLSLLKTPDWTEEDRAKVRLVEGVTMDGASVFRGGDLEGMRRSGEERGKIAAEGGARSPALKRKRDLELTCGFFGRGTTEDERRAFERGWDEAFQQATKELGKRR